MSPRFFQSQDVRPPLTRAQVTELQAACPRPPPLPPVVQPRRELAGQKINLAKIYPCANGWSVPSETGPNRYLVLLNDEDRRYGGDETPWARRPECSCPDNRMRHTRCKHIAAVMRKLAAYEITSGPLVREYEALMEAAREWTP